MNTNGTEKGEVELWKQIPGYRMYHASTMGRIRSYSRKSVGAVLNPYIDPDGYANVNVAANGIIDHFRVHTLVARTFLGPCPPGKRVRHKDFNRTNNAPSNLMYDTHANIAAAYAAHYRETLGGDYYRSNSAKVPPSMARAWREEFKAGAKVADIAKTYGQKQHYVREVLVGKRHKYAGGPIVRLTRNLPPEAIVTIRNAHRAGYSLGKLAQMFERNVAAISRIVNGKTGKNVGGPIKRRDY